MATFRGKRQCAHRPATLRPARFVRRASPPCTPFAVIASEAWQSRSFSPVRSASGLNHRLDCRGKPKLCSSGFLECLQAVESNGFPILHGLPEATEIHG
jgi:hypothetical protein